MKPNTRTWIISGIIFSLAVMFTVFCGLGIANMSKKETTAPETSSEAPQSSDEIPQSSSELPPISTKESPSVIPSTDENKSSGRIRQLTEAELKVIEDKFLDIPQFYDISGPRDTENRSQSAVEYHGTFSLKYKQVYVFNPQTRSDVSLCFILSEEYGYTEKVLDILKENNVRATFFTDWAYAENNPEIIERIRLEKHELGSLGASNPEPGIGLFGASDVMNDLWNLHKHIEQLYNYTMTKLYFNHDAYKDRTVILATQMGYEIIFYSAYYEDDDPKKHIDTAAFLQSLEEQAHKGVIYRLHTVNAATPQILSDFLTYLKENGFNVGLIN